MTDIIAKLVGDPPSYGEHLEVIETIWLTSGVVRIKVQRTKKPPHLPKAEPVKMSLIAYSKAIDYVETLEIDFMLAFPMWNAPVEFDRRLWEENRSFELGFDPRACLGCGHPMRHRWRGIGKCIGHACKCNAVRG